MKKLFLTLLKLGLICAALGLLPWLIINITTAHKIHSPEEVESKPITIVFGAGLRRDSTPTDALRERLVTAANLYNAGKTNILLMSGDNRVLGYDEPSAMKEYAIGLGVPAEDIVLDFAGRSTYDTCFRAKEIFGVDEAILVTQAFHLPRALYICQVLGIEADGAEADYIPYMVRTRTWGTIREIPAAIKAVWMLHISKPLPVLGEPLPIILSKETP